MGLKVSVIGLSEATRYQFPRDAQVWCLAWDRELRYVADRVFEMHDAQDLAQTYGKGLDRYMREIGDCRNLVTPDNYPFDAVAKITGDYWCSSIAYMLALAIYEGAEEIGIYGVEMTDDYGYQRENTAYLIGLARGRGIKVHIPAGAPLLQYLDPPDREYLGRYGKTA